MEKNQKLGLWREKSRLEPFPLWTLTLVPRLLTKKAAPRPGHARTDRDADEIRSRHQYSV